MQPLEKSLRRKLEDTVKEAREVAEAAARAALEQLGVGEAAPYSHLGDPERELRRKLRVHGRQLGDLRNTKAETQEIDRLVEEVAYEHWHRMLFARFLAQNDLLMYPDPNDPVALTLEECEDLAADEGAKNGWELASRFAARMLPQIFRPDSPVFQLELPPEHQQKLERLVAGLPGEVFTASDSLGWVYQFWQAKKKDEVNASEVKIGARELPAVTQLFTEPYMVSFLLDNTLGAWWASKRLTESDLCNAQSEEELRQKASLSGVPLQYLRFVKVARPSRSGPHLDERTLSITHGEHVPHWTCDRAVYHVSFRLADSIPQSKRDEWIHERDSIIKNAASLKRDLTAEENKKIRHLYSERIEKYLDSGHGECLLAQNQIAELVANALKHFDGERYTLHAWCVMPNHVHVIVEPHKGWELSKIIHSWKSFTAHEANKRLNRSGDFWQRDAYNHIIRSEKEYYFQIQYTWENPDKAGLKDWLWRWRKPDRDDLATTWAPAGGTFADWPNRLKEFKLLDPCCGSGHFVVTAFLMLVPMRMELEQLSLHEAVDTVLNDNLYGLEIDRRCTEIAAFNLAMAAWRFTGYRPLPQLNIACTGLSIGDNRKQWMTVLDGQSAPMNLQFFFGQLFDLFRKAPTLGSLINPHQFLGSSLLDEKSLAQLHRILFEVIAKESKSATDLHEMGIAAQGLLRAAELLTEHYTLVATNVPYLKRNKQDTLLKEHLQTHYPHGKSDLATAFILRSLEFCAKGGAAALVTPQNWLFLSTYFKLRHTLLGHRKWNEVVRLGPGAFETISGHVVNVILLLLSADTPTKGQLIAGIDVSEGRNADEKASQLLNVKISQLAQAKISLNPDARVTFDSLSTTALLSDIADYGKGSTTGDSLRFLLWFWEVPRIEEKYVKWLNSPKGKDPWSGRSQICTEPIDSSVLKSQLGCWLRGNSVWVRIGAAVNKMSGLEPFLYSGEVFDDNICPLCPKDESVIPAVWAYIESGEYQDNVRAVDQALKVTAATLTKVPFDLPHWQKVASEKYPNGLPEPESNDPTQWLFHGRPEHSSAPLQVAVVRLLGYRWPAELDQEMRLSRRARDLISLCDELLPLADGDGIVCIPPVRGEASAADRLLGLLAKAYGTEWSTDILTGFLRDVGFGDKSLEIWLRDGFFPQHCELFHQRPFIWQIWDGLRDGFSVLINYHKLDRKNLETLIYTYLGDWIARCRDVARASRSGAGSGTGTEKMPEPDRDGRAIISDPQEKLAAAENLKKRLELILVGEAPYDIFVPWKPLQLQPIGWDPDLNDGVRINIRPFLSVPDVGKRGAGVLRDKPNINWNKDRGKDVPSAPWYHLGPQYGGNEGDRINNHHLTIEEKLAARKRKGDS